MVSLYYFFEEKLCSLVVRISMAVSLALSGSEHSKSEAQSKGHVAVDKKDQLARLTITRSLSAV